MQKDIGLHAAKSLISGNTKRRWLQMQSYSKNTAGGFWCGAFSSKRPKATRGHNLKAPWRKIQYKHHVDWVQLISTERPH